MNTYNCTLIKKHNTYHGSGYQPAASNDEFLKLIRLSLHDKTRGHQITDLCVKFVPLLPVLLWVFVKVACVADVSNSRNYWRLQQQQPTHTVHCVWSNRHLSKDDWRITQVRNCPLGFK